MTAPSLETAAPAAGTPDELCQLLIGYRFKTHTEQVLQDGIEQALKAAGVSYTREHRLSAEDRPDFMVGSVALEVKIQGGAAKALRQVSRYLEHPEVTAVILVGTPAWVRQMPGQLHGKPLYALRLFANFF